MANQWTRRQFVGGSASLVAAAGLSLPRGASAAEPDAVCTLENDYLKYVIGKDGRNFQFADKQTGTDCCARQPGAGFARVKVGGKYHQASSARLADGRLAVEFGPSGVRAVLEPTVHKHYLVLEVVACEGEGVEELVLVDVPLTLQGSPEEPFAACALALNLRTNVAELPRANTRLRATCYARFGLAGAKVAIIGCPQDQLRPVMQEVVTEAKDLPKSPIGGPWALGQPINQGSYLFNFGNMSLEKTDAWIELAQRLGMNQIDFHGGNSFRFGDCRPNPKTYPDGLASLKAVIDKLHGAGIAAGLHTYAFFINKSCPWVTPAPDPRLAKDATFTLAEDLAPESDAVAVAEPTDAMSTITGFFVRNSVTLRIDDELITYGGVAKEPPFAFTSCKRGAYGTRVAAHAKGAQVHHLKECFGLFVPDPDSTLLAEVAARTAEAFNTCGFDMMYLDALDGSDVLGGRENAWHYGSKFVFELWKRLERPALMEMSTFHHHLWYVRSRYVAWDHPNRSHKKFIDVHCEANERNRRMFLPGELGWWALKSWTGPQGEPTHTDDIEYLMAKCLGTDTGFALMGISPENVGSVPALPRLADIIRRYEELRHSGRVPEATKARLRAPGDEFRLLGSLQEGWQFQPVEYDKHKVLGADGPTSTWTVTNRFHAQPAAIRIEALMAAGPYDDPGNVTLADFASADDFPARAAAPGVTGELAPSDTQLKIGPVSGCLAASNARAGRDATWVKWEKTFDPPLDLHAHQALGVWVHGDGQGEVLNFQLQSPTHIVRAHGEHYVIVDFTGWRYFELIEPEGERYADYRWPYGNIYSIYRSSVNFRHVEKLGLWLNHLPPKGKATCYLSPIRAMPVVKTKLTNPKLTIGDRTLLFPVEIESGSYLEFHAQDDCKLYGPQGELIREVVPQGAPPLVQPGPNQAAFHADTRPGLSARAQVSVVSCGEPFV